jgi:hypothetical protein
MFQVTHWQIVRFLLERAGAVCVFLTLVFSDMGPLVTAEGRLAATSSSSCQWPGLKPRMPREPEQRAPLVWLCLFQCYATRSC